MLIATRAQAQSSTSNEQETTHLLVRQVQELQAKVAALEMKQACLAVAPDGTSSPHKSLPLNQSRKGFRWPPTFHRRTTRP